MKMNNIFKGISFAMVALAALTTTSCKDEPDAYKIADGTPVVNYIRPVDASAKDSLLTSAALRSTICIVGENLRSSVLRFRLLSLVLCQTNGQLLARK